MQSFHDLQILAPGLLYHGKNHFSLNKMQEGIHLTIEPESNSTTELTVALMGMVPHKQCVIEVNFMHENAKVEIFGLYKLFDKRQVDIQIIMNHFVPRCTSKQIWKGVLHDLSKATFEGKIVVHPKAQKTNAQLTNKNLLLSKSAEVNTRPFLEIYADDVQCSHGATVGCLDESALFYLRSRGITESKARQLLVDAFVHELFEQLPHADMQRYIESMVTDEQIS